MKDLSLKQRLERGNAVLETLKYCREKSGMEHLGLEAERAIVEPILRDTALASSLDEIDEELGNIHGKQT
jgi:hypothetical protein